MWSGVSLHIAADDGRVRIRGKHARNVVLRRIYDMREGSTGSVKRRDGWRVDKNLTTPNVLVWFRKGEHRVKWNRDTAADASAALRATALDHARLLMTFLATGDRLNEEGLFRTAGAQERAKELVKAMDEGRPITLCPPGSRPEPSGSADAGADADKMFSVTLTDADSIVVADLIKATVRGGG